MGRQTFAWFTQPPAVGDPRLSKAAGFLERNVVALAKTLDHAARADETARRRGLLQKLDPRAKCVGIFAWILAAAATSRLAVVGTIFALAVALAVLSAVPVRTSLGRVWTGVLVFTGSIALPALFLTPGAPVCRIPLLEWNVTAPGLLAATRLVGRAETTATLAALLVLTTPWTHLLKALRTLRVPKTAVVILGMTHRYLFLLLGLARDYFEARRSRQVGRLDNAQRRHAATATAGVLLGRSLALSDEVFMAMRARGFRGEVHLLQDARFRTRDGLALAAFVAVAALGLL